MPPRGADPSHLGLLVGFEQDEFSDVTGAYEGASPVQHLREAVVQKLGLAAVVDLERLKGNRWVLEP